MDDSFVQFYKNVASPKLNTSQQPINQLARSYDDYEDTDDIDYVLRVSTSKVEETVITKKVQVIPKKRNTLFVPTDMSYGGKKHLSQEDLRSDYYAADDVATPSYLKLETYKNVKKSSYESTYHRALSPKLSPKQIKIEEPNDTMNTVSNKSSIYNGSSPKLSSTASNASNVSYASNASTALNASNASNTSTLNKTNYSQLQTKIFQPFTSDKFSIGRLIGKGYFSNVYFAKERTTNNPVALKIMSLDVINKNRLNNQVKDQIFMLRKLNHSNIIKLIACYYDRSNIYMVMELAKWGYNLAQLLEEQPNKCLDIRTTATYINLVASALYYVHADNIIHRNIRPENLLIGTDSKIKLSGFGSSTYGPISTNFSFNGSVDYLAPEILSRQEYNYNVDLWSLGVLTYDLLVGSPAFLSSTEAEAVKKILTVDVNHAPSMNVTVKSFIDKLLQFYPEDRMQLLSIFKDPFIMNKLRS